ncbi:protein-glutamate O-methyltransferase CheR [Pseudomonas sp. Choline-3u-10]|jgi:chemotaxis protein methyltransferase CheR|uniref:CheR family methyltransferase n=1 Tax=Pseudomonadaceae TaxID=135621 RepID=UPI000617AED3|nr:MULTISPECIES: protein-glutamate O-methyltransferase CheR [Pseudomonadaceae]MAL35555.1 chemotaxis protein CheR [Pseudomonas sp.]MBU0949548.1 protein-glutamate O-methyltransferase CheR [Gammaproteobacteria bacterium]KJJ64694.1 chemotaxis protein CheR [Pseudomonas sp. 10B238]MBK3793785.1 protein-glutamate O-methyltransferase CheR [Stutzerimonas stutzeri]MBK3875275.1 protein-glutamate O-methyltransferase CheR [Stutzerimonas stutzeri]|tara:strand:+ start:1814 stop:2632 length:819 start_codon:yes stop_codon:yes gene_type:complete
MPDRNQAIELKLLIEAIYLRYSYDFRDYSSASLKRRVLLALKQMHCENISQLQRRILYDPQAFMELLQFLTIPVSEMFRDPSYYLALREQVIPVLRTYPSLKIWIAGCSTGEEVYSMAILLKEEGLLDRTILYATDINPRSLERARQGIFNIDNMRQYTSNYQGAGGKHSLSDYYTAAYDSAIMDKSLKENITFADHSLATDSVFAETQLISCRNVLIYFNKPLQNRAFGLFYDSLCHRGFLGLGSKETVEFSGYAEQFEAFDKPERVFRKL